MVDCAGSVTCVGSHTAVRTATMELKLSLRILFMLTNLLLAVSSSHLDRASSNTSSPLLSPLPSPSPSPQSPKMSEEIVLPLWEAREVGVRSGDWWTARIDLRQA